MEKLKNKRGIQSPSLEPDVLAASRTIIGFFLCDGNTGAVQALSGYGFLLVDAQQPIERAHAIKSQEEVVCVKASLCATEIAVARFRQCLRRVGA